MATQTSEVSKIILAGLFTIIAGVIGAMVAINTLEQGVEAAKAKARAAKRFGK